MPITIQDKFSWVPFKIEILFEEETLGIGTAFAYLHNEQTYLITNWHNVSGRHPDALKIIHKELAIPNKLKLHYPAELNKESDHSPEESRVGWTEFIFDLYKDDVPKWLEHPIHGHKVDAVAIPFSIEASMLHPANAEELQLEKITLRPSLDVFVLGYPRGLSGGGKLPIWKRGSIASEPDFDLDELPKFFIDTATREGMSGSPVYAQNNGYCVPEGKTSKEAIIGEARRFAGIYSGRVGDDSFLAQLGIVWKEKAIQEIIEGEKLGVPSSEI